MNVLLIRRNATDGIEVKQAFEQLGLNYCDVHRHEHISIVELNSNGKTDIRFFNWNISRFDRIFFINTPSVPEIGNAVASNKTHTFEYCEMDASVISALQNYTDKLINAGVLNMSLSITNRYFLVFLFRSLGWQLHPSLFNLPQALPDKTLYQVHLLLTRTGYRVYPDNDVFSPIISHAEELILKTRKAMWQRGLDILTVSCVVTDGNLCVLNISESFAHVSSGILAGALKEII
ncbi:hypothetical protein [Emticicia fluvialis]|uniref:hypothetical protein n=1 Tax=Emticicia fluvialis TaxID=2974474 RepID=UPI002166B0D8|nr:hypothetical protein [Emticicia fluvialis]